jgi:hypothetical protein
MSVRLRAFNDMGSVMSEGGQSTNEINSVYASLKHRSRRAVLVFAGSAPLPGQTEALHRSIRP